MIKIERLIAEIINIRNAFNSSPVYRIIISFEDLREDS